MSLEAHPNRNYEIGLLLYDGHDEGLVPVKTCVGNRRNRIIILNALRAHSDNQPRIWRQRCLLAQDALEMDGIGA